MEKAVFSTWSSAIVSTEKWNNKKFIFSICPTPLPPGQDRFKQFPTPGPEGLDLSPGGNGKR